MGGCEFCEIIRGERDAHVITRDSGTIAFLDAQPAVHGHTLVAPTTHHESIFGTDRDLAAPIFETVEAVAIAMEGVLDPDGFSLFHTTGDLVGHITHAHVHLLPRYREDSVHLALPRESLTEPDAGRLAEQLGFDIERGAAERDAEFDWR